MVKTEEQRLTKQLLVLQKEEAFYINILVQRKTETTLALNGKDKPDGAGNFG
jgi:hypothetical protein